MVYVHRFLGQWLDKHHSLNKASIIRKALSINSGVDEYLKQIEVRRRFTLAVEKGRYFYMVPKEVSIGDTRADRYYRLEMRGYERIHPTPSFTETEHPFWSKPYLRVKDK